MATRDAGAGLRLYIDAVNVGCIRVLNTQSQWGIHRVTFATSAGVLMVDKEFNKQVEKKMVACIILNHFEKDTELHIRELSRNMEISHRTAANYLEIMRSEGVLKCRISGKNHLYSLKHDETKNGLVFYWKGMARILDNCDKGKEAWKKVSDKCRGVDDANI